MSQDLRHIETLLGPGHVEVSSHRIDPVEFAVNCGYDVAVDILKEIVQARTSSRCLEIQQMVKGLIRAMEQIELEALRHSDEILGKLS